MVKLPSIIVLVIYAVLVESSEWKMLEKSNDTLELVHVLFRHGDRTPDIAYLYPTDPYFNNTYFPFGYGELNNDGKLKCYKFGERLRHSYDAFLGDVYTPDVIKAFSSSSNRCQSSLQLVLAGLFPVRSKARAWNDFGLNWEPIPYKLFSMVDVEDKIFGGVIACKRFPQHLYKIEKDLSKKLEKYKEVIAYIREKSQLEAPVIYLTVTIYVTLLSQESYGLPIPSWAQSIYPQPMQDLAVIAWQKLATSKEARTIMGGLLFNHVIELTHQKVEGKVPKPKIILYSGHDVNIGGILGILGEFQQDMPKYTSHIIFEVHNFNGKRFIKILYQNYEKEYPQLIHVSSCGYNCSLDDLTSIASEHNKIDKLC